VLFGVAAKYSLQKKLHEKWALQLHGGVGVGGGGWGGVGGGGGGVVGGGGGVWDTYEWCYEGNRKKEFVSGDERDDNQKQAT